MNSSVAPSDTVRQTAVKTGKPSQRERLVAAMIELCARSGYDAVSVARVSSRAGVSSSTFYEQFESKEECLLAAYRAAAERVLGAMTPATGPGDWSAAARTALDALFAAVRAEPDAARVLLIEARGAGPRLTAAHTCTFEELERRVEVVLDRQSDGHRLDVPAIALVGAVRSVVARALRDHTEDELPVLADDLLGWIDSYAIPEPEHRWSVGPDALRAPSPTGKPASLPGGSADELLRIPRGRHGLPASVVARNRRLRLIYATAEVTMNKGYAKTTVTDIVAAAGVARDVFYEHFTDKQHAFLEAQQFPTQYILDTCASAYFSADDWPERVWRGLDALLALIVSNPAISHLRLVECYAAGPVAVRRAEEITRAFTIFLEEGYRCRPPADRPPRLFSQAITGAIFEIIQRRFAGAQPGELGRTLLQLVYIVIAPFTGAMEARRLVAARIGTRQSAVSGS